jgi:integrase
MGKNPRVRIGLREIAAQPPGPFILWDSEVRGFCARRQFSEVITYSVIYRTRDGIQRWLKLGHHGVWTPTQAREKAKQVRFAADNGEDPSALRHALRNGATMAELLDQYVADMDARRGINGKKNTTIKSDKSRIATHIRPQLGKYRITSITQDQIEKFTLSMSQGSARRILALLGSVFTFAIKNKLRSDNPVKGIMKPKDVKKTRRLSMVEYAQLGERLSGGASVPHDIFIFLAVSGWRSTETRLLKHSEIDIERRVATLKDTKTGTSIRPLSGAAIEIIKRQSHNGEYIFNRNGNAVSNLEPYWRKLELAREITQHTLRHSFASLAADMGFSDNVIAGMLGHSRSSITSRYIHLEKALIEASDAVAIETLRLMRSI